MSIQMCVCVDSTFRKSKSGLVFIYCLNCVTSYFIYCIDKRNVDYNRHSTTILKVARFSAIFSAEEAERDLIFFRLLSFKSDSTLYRN